MRLQGMMSAGLAALFLSACSGGGGSGGICQSLSASNATVTTDTGSCAACDVTTPAAAADGNFNSAARVTIGAPSSRVSVRATAQPGASFPGGQRIGLYWAKPSDAAYGLTLNTYLGDSLQESNALCGVCGGNNPHTARYESVTVSEPFDAVEVVLTSSQTNTGQAVYEIYEICDN